MPIDPAQIALRFLVRTADLNPPLGYPGGPCQVLDRIRTKARKPVQQGLVEKVEQGEDLSLPEARRVYEPSVEPISRMKGTMFNFLALTPHAQYRMDLRGIPVSEVVAAFRDFQKQWGKEKGQKTYLYREWERAIQRTQEIRWQWQDLYVVFQPVGLAGGRLGAKVITTYRGSQGSAGKIDEKDCMSFDKWVKQDPRSDFDRLFRTADLCYRGHVEPSSLRLSFDVLAAAKTPNDLPDGWYVQTEWQISGILVSLRDESGWKQGHVFMAEHSGCGGAWTVRNSHAPHGWGPLLYDVAMEYAGKKGLMPDRGGVSADALGVWRYYLSTRLNRDVDAYPVWDDPNIRSPRDCGEFPEEDQQNEPMNYRYVARTRNTTKKLTGMGKLKRASKTADLTPPLGYPGGPCHVINRIDEEITNPRLRDLLVDQVEGGYALSNAAASKVYQLEQEKGPGGKFKTLLISAHAQYRMDQRGITVVEVRLALQGFLKAWMDGRSRQDPEARNWEMDMAYGEPIKFTYEKIKLTLVFTAAKGSVNLVTAYWAGLRDPRPVDEESCLTQRWAELRLPPVPGVQTFVRIDEQKGIDNDVMKDVALPPGSATPGGSGRDIPKFESNTPDNGIPDRPRTLGEPGEDRGHPTNDNVSDFSRRTMTSRESGVERRVAGLSPLVYKHIVLNAHAELNPHVSKWVFLGNEAAKKALVQSYTRLDDNLKDALDHEVRGLMPSSLTVYRSVRPGQPLDRGGDSVTDDLSTRTGEIHAWKVTPADVMLHYGQKGSWLSSKAYGHEREIILKPGVKLQYLGPVQGHVASKTAREASTHFAGWWESPNGTIGDGPADVMGPAMDDLRAMYWEGVGREPTMGEIRDTVEFVTGPEQDEGILKEARWKQKWKPGKRQKRQRGKEKQKSKQYYRKNRSKILQKQKVKRSKGSYKNNPAMKRSEARRKKQVRTRKGSVVQSSQVLYHTTSWDKAQAALRSGRLTGGHSPFISLSETPLFGADISHGDVVLILDASRLRGQVLQVKYTEKWGEDHLDQASYIAGDGWEQQFQYPEECFDDEFGEEDSECTERAWKEAMLMSFMWKSNEKEWISSESVEDLKIKGGILGLLVPDQASVPQAEQLLSKAGLDLPVYVGRGKVRLATDFAPPRQRGGPDGQAQRKQQREEYRDDALEHRRNRSQDNRKSRRYYHTVCKRNRKCMERREEYKENPDFYERRAPRQNQKEASVLTVPDIAFVIGPDHALGYVDSVSGMTGMVNFRIDEVNVSQMGSMEVEVFLRAATLMSEEDVTAFFELVDVEIGLEAYDDLDEPGFRECAGLYGVDPDSSEFKGKCKGLVGEGDVSSMSADQLDTVNDQLVLGILEGGGEPRSSDRPDDNDQTISELWDPHLYYGEVEDRKLENS